MINNSRKFFLAAIIACASVDYSLASTTTACSDSTFCCSGCTQSQNLWQPHAFSVSMSREILLEKEAWANVDDAEGWHGTFDVGFEYMQTLGSNCKCAPTKCCTTLGSVPFWGTGKTNQMTIGDNSGNYNVDAYQFGLGPVTTNGTFRIDPVVYQTGGDFFLYAGAHRDEKGFFVKLHGPVGITGVNPRLSQAGDLEAVDYPDYDLVNAAEETENPYENIIQAFAGGQAAGDLRAMRFGKINCSQTSSVKFGDFAGAVGYNFYADERKHIGAAVRFSAPTGNKAEGVYVLEPIFGRNGHWAAGGELFAHWRVWEAEDSDQFFDIWFDGTAEHLFRSTHMRSFDLKINGLGSKYLLIANYANGTYQNEIQNAINLTTLPVNSTFSVEGNFALFFDYHNAGWSAGLGYEGWGRSCEELDIDCGCPGAFNLNNYAVLGRQTVLQGEVDCAHLCDPTATIGKSLAACSDDAKDATNATNRIPSEMWNALNIDGQRAHVAYTSKVFAQVAYTCKDSDYNPYLGVSGGAEFTNLSNSAASFWSVGLQGGLAF